MIAQTAPQKCRRPTQHAKQIRAIKSSPRITAHLRKHTHNLTRALEYGAGGGRLLIDKMANHVR
jgi:hypothetical protein